MKKYLLLLMALMLAMFIGMTAQAEETAVEGTPAFIFWQDQDWWPAAWSVEDDYWKPVPAMVTGEGWYTVKLEAHMPSWFYSGGNTNIGAQKLAVVIKDGNDLFPGLYMQITDVRIDGVSYPCGAVTYGQTGYENINNEEGGKVYWDANDTYGVLWDQWMIDNAGTIETGDTWESAAQAQKFDAFDVSVLKNPASIEIDFFLSAQQDVKPEGGPELRVIGEGPVTNGYNVPLSAQSDLQLNAWIQFADSDWWPSHNDAESGNGVDLTKAVVTGQGNYTVGYNFNKDWNGGVGAVGAQRFMIIVQDGFAKLPNYFMQVTAIRADGQDIPLVGNHGFGQVGYDTDFGADADDAYAILYDQWMIENQAGAIPEGHTVWNGGAGTAAAIDPNSFTGQGNIEVDFIITDAAGEQPEIPLLEYDFSYYPNNTMGVAGYSLRDDLGIGNKWYNVVPVNLTKNGIYKIPLVASNMYIIGDAIVTVDGGKVTVTYETVYATPGSMKVTERCVKWFKSIDEISEDFINDPKSDIGFGDAVATAELGNMAYLFILNNVDYRLPITINGNYLARYNHKHIMWEAYRAELDAMVAELVPAVE